MYTLVLHKEEVLEGTNYNSLNNTFLNIWNSCTKAGSDLLAIVLASIRPGSVLAKAAKILAIAVKASANSIREAATGESVTAFGNPAERAGALLDKYGNAILRTAYSYLHNMSDAEDIVQDTLIQYIRKAPVFENDNHEKAWLITVASNLSKNKIDYLNVRKADELSEELVAENKEDLAFVWEAVKQLPEKYREVIHLFYQEGYSTKDIAGILKRNESTVRSDLNRGRQQLKNILKEGYDFE
ncbi:RNA polymerase sigma factor [Butyrivibrio sp. JL13D10]|uniref:RNA polymerase sigma factor n=1 Tax=Butyrivibrio sp. JL13D10 TaxID=3236815 RepID=UPI0038B66AB0